MKKILSRLKRVSPLVLMATGFIAGLAVMYLYFQPKIDYQEKSAKSWSGIATMNETLANQNKQEATSYKDQLASASAQIKTLLARPPKIEYRTQTQYVQTPADTGGTTNCRPDYAGGMYCTSDAGTQTHCRSNYAGGMICN